LDQAISDVRREASTNRQESAAAQIDGAKLECDIDGVDHQAGRSRRWCLRRSPFETIDYGTPTKNARWLLCHCKCGEQAAYQNRSQDRFHLSLHPKQAENPAEFAKEDDEILSGVNRDLGCGAEA
jgi:hypothetical protein